tara:strand:- start:547 stop:813 length:267 start_codon:yes stop_codon:yes gene_type:complete
MNDHQDSENFAYDKEWADIQNLLDEAEREQNKRWLAFQKCPKPLRQHHWNNYKGLEGVINTLRWVLGDLKMSKNKVLGRDKNENRGKR